MRLAILLLCTAVGFGQSTTSPPETKAQREGRCGEEFGLSVGAHGQQLGSLDILSDTQGVDFGPFLERMLQEVNDNWHKRVPDSDSMKKGELAIEFAIRKDGKLAEMCLVATSGDVALDRAAWEGITASNPFLPLPSEFTGPYLAKRFRFSYNPDKSDLDGSAEEILPEPAHTNEGTPISSTPAIPSSEQRAAAQTGATHTKGALDVLSNTYGIDFGNYLTGVLRNVRENWLRLIPASDQLKNGRLAIEFEIAKDGKVPEMRLVATSGDRSLDSYAWGSITASNPFPALPKEFPDPYLRLRFRYYYNLDKSDLEVLGNRISPEFAHSNESAPISSTPSKSGIAVDHDFSIQPTL